MMLSRNITASQRADLAQYPAVALSGPRQAGMTTVALDIATQPGSVCLDLESGLCHPVAGASWEGFVIENLITAAGPHTAPCFYRSGGGAEVGLLLARPGDKLCAIEIQRSLSPKVTRGFHVACNDLQPMRKFVVYPGTETFMLGDDIQATPLEALCEALGGQGTQP